MVLAYDMLCMCALLLISRSQHTNSNVKAMILVSNNNLKKQRWSPPLSGMLAGDTEGDFPVKPACPAQSWVQRVRPAGGTNHQHMGITAALVQV